jgi:hypothetical protein
LIRIACRLDGPRWHRRYYEAFAKGFKRWHRAVAAMPADQPPSDDTPVVMFGPNYFPNIHRAMAGSLSLMTVNRCFVGDANDNVAIGLKGFNGYGEFATSPRGRAQEFDRLGLWPEPAELSPAADGRVLILGEYPSPCDDRNEIEEFYALAVRWARQECGSDADIRFRPHPHHRRAPASVPMTDEPPENFRTVYTYASTYGVHCALRGLDVRGSGASLVSHGYRSGLRRRVANAQWNIKEIESGEFFEHLRGRFYRADA